MSLTNHALRGTKVLVTGATGFIGGRLAERLATEEGAIVTGLGRQLDKVPFLQEAGVNLQAADLRDGDALRPLLAGQNIVFHAAAMLGRSTTSPDAAYDVNVAATANLVRLAADGGARRFIHVSSINAYGPPERNRVDESYPVNTDQRDAYGRTKASGELHMKRAAQEVDIEWVIVRPGMVYGPRSRGWSGRMVRVLQRGLPVIFGDGGGNAYPVYIDNLIDGMLLTAVRSAAVGEAFNFVDRPVTWRQFFGYYAAMGGYKVRSLPLWAARLLALASEILPLGLPLTRERLEFYIKPLVFPTTKAEQLLGYRQRVSIEEGMARAEAWLRAEGYLETEA